MCRLLDLAAAGRPGHGPVHLLLKFASQLGFAWDSSEEGWLRPGFSSLRMLTGPFQHFKSAIVSAWRGRAAGILTSRKGFRGGPLLGYDGTKQLLFSSHLRERDKMLLRSILCGKGGLERIPTWEIQRGRWSLPLLWWSRWGWSSFLGVPFSPICSYQRAS